MNESDRLSSEIGELSHRLKESQESYEALSQQNYSYKTSVGDFSRLLSNFVTTGEVRTAIQIEESVAGFKELPFALTALLGYLNESRIKQQHQDREYATQIANLQSDIASLKE